MRKFQFEGKGNVSGDRVRELRLRARLSQTALAAKMQTEGAIIEQDAVSRIESGSRLVTDYELLVLTRIFHVVPKDLAAAFREKCDAEGAVQAQIIKRAIEEFLQK